MFEQPRLESLESSARTIAWVLAGVVLAGKIVAREVVDALVECKRLHVELLARRRARKV